MWGAHSEAAAQRHLPSRTLLTRTHTHVSFHTKFGPLFTLHSSLFTFHFSLFTFLFSLPPAHFSLSTSLFSLPPSHFSLFTFLFSLSHAAVGFFSVNFSILFTASCTRGELVIMRMRRLLRRWGKPLSGRTKSTKRTTRTPSLSFHTSCS
jgi:hypothetical protein